MNPDDRIRAAFEDLQDRTARQVDTADTLARVTRVRRVRPVPAFAAAAAVVVVIGGIAALGLLPGLPPDTTGVLVRPTTATTAGTVPGTTGPETTATTVPTTTPATADRFRVDTEKVAADATDPYLNVRTGAGTANPIVAKLPPTYTGVRWTGDGQTQPDGNVWYRIELIDPVRFTGELTGGAPYGWVNAAYLLPLADGISVSTDQVPACQGTSMGFGDGDGSTHWVYSLETARLADDCLRIVVGLASGDAPYAFDQVAEGTAVGGTAGYRQPQSAGPFVLDLLDTTSVWPGATEASGVYVVRNTDRTLSLVVPGNNVQTYETVLDGRLVIDLRGVSDVPAAQGLVALTRQPSSGGSSFEVTGVARPFEANLGVTVEDSSGTRVAAVFSGSLTFGTIRTDTYAVQTDDWSEAWGRFAVKVEGLSPGDYTLVLDAQGAVENPVTMRVPFAIAAPNTADYPDWFAPFLGPPSLADQSQLDAVRSLVDFARGFAPASSIPLADQVTLGLGLVESRTLTRAQLADPTAWVSEVHEFDGYGGDFSVLDSLARSPFVRITTGPMPHCAGPPLDWPTSFDGLTQVNVEPIGIDSCIQWSGVSLFFDGNGDIAAAVLDLYGP